MNYVMDFFCISLPLLFLLCLNYMTVLRTRADDLTGVGGSEEL